MNQPHGLGCNISFEVKDGMGNIKRRVKLPSIPMLNPFIKFGKKIFAGKSFTQEFLQALSAVIQGGTVSLGGTTYGGDISKLYIGDGGGLTINGAGSGSSPAEGTMPAYFNGVTYDKVLASDLYTSSKFGTSGANLLMPTSSTFNGTTITNLLVQRSGYNIIVTAMLNNTNGTINRTITDLFLIGTHKPASTALFTLYSRDKLDNTGTYKEAQVPVTMGTKAKLAFNIVIPQQFGANNYLVGMHENFVKYLFNSLFISTGFETFLATDGVTNLTQTSTTYGGSNLVLDALTTNDYNNSISGSYKLSGTNQGGDIRDNGTVIGIGGGFLTKGTLQYQQAASNNLETKFSMSQDFSDPVGNTTVTISGARLLLKNGSNYARLMGVEKTVNGSPLTISPDQILTVKTEFTTACGAMTPKTSITSTTVNTVNGSIVGTTSSQSS